VLEEVLPSGTLVSNDVELNGRDPAILILNGANMSGKSTYLRQTALIATWPNGFPMCRRRAPASASSISSFTRIGASDRLTEGESTFQWSRWSKRAHLKPRDQAIESHHTSRSPADFVEDQPGFGRVAWGLRMRAVSTISTMNVEFTFRQPVGGPESA